MVARKRHIPLIHTQQIGAEALALPPQGLAVQRVRNEGVALAAAEFDGVQREGVAAHGGVDAEVGVVEGDGAEGGGGGVVIAGGGEGDVGFAEVEVAFVEDGFGGRVGDVDAAHLPVLVVHVEGAGDGLLEAVVGLRCG